MAKTPLEIASLARMHTKKAVKTLAAIMNEPHAPYAARVAAAEVLLDRRVIDVTGGPGFFRLQRTVPGCPWRPKEKAPAETGAQVNERCPAATKRLDAGRNPAKARRPRPV
jgi:hypothetical protein